MRIGFEGQVAVVAGAAGGMGRQIALDLLAAGASVVGSDLAAEPVGMADAGGAWTYVQGDLSREATVMEVMQTAYRRFGGVDVVANTVGVLWFDLDRSLVDISEDVWDRVFAINLKPMIWLARHAVPLMRARGGGAFVHLASVDALGGDPVPQEAYGASKAAMLRMSRSIAVQFAADRIRSNCILPGSIHTPMQKRWDEDPGRLAALEEAIPLGRVGTAGDISAAALFLLSSAASYVTGADLVVDGGATAGI